MKITVQKAWYCKLQDAKSEWNKRAGEKFESIVLGLLKRQREGTSEGKLKGTKNAIGLDVVPVSQGEVELIYSDHASQAKFRKLMSDYHLAIKDGSWVAPSLAHQLDTDPKCNTWHITEPDSTEGNTSDETIEVEFSDCYGVFKKFPQYRKSILEADGTPINNTTDIFQGIWAIKDYDNGDLKWYDFMAVGQVAEKVLNPPKQKDCRVYDAIALCKKELRPKCFINSITKIGMREFADIPAAITITARVGALGLGITSATDDDLIQWAKSLDAGTNEDPYEKIYNGIWKWDPKCTAYRDFDPKKHAYGPKKDFQSIRKIVKLDLQYVCNNSGENLKRCAAIYYGKLKCKHGGEYQRARRCWALYKSLEVTYKPLWEVVNLCNRSGQKDAFYRIHTLGEKTIMDSVADEARKNGFSLHRVHDAFWTTDENLIAIAERRNELKFMGRAISLQASKLATKGKSLCQKYVPQELIDWVRGGILKSSLPQ